MDSDSAGLAPQPWSSPKVMVPRQNGLTQRPERPRVTKWSRGMAAWHHGSQRGPRSILPASCPIVATVRRTPTRVRQWTTMEPLAELRRLIARHAGDGVTQTPLDGVTVMASATTTRPIGSVSEPALAVVAQGAKRTALGESVFAYGAGQCLLV